MARLPPHFARKHKFCKAPGCVFARKEWHKPARVDDSPSGKCIFCEVDARGRLLAESSPTLARHLRESLATWHEEGPKDVLQQAWSRLSEDFRCGCPSYEAWLTTKFQEEASRKKEKAAMWKEDSHRVLWLAARSRRRAFPLPSGGWAHGVLGLSGTEWNMHRPEGKQRVEDGVPTFGPPCGHRLPDMPLQPEWRCPVNSTSVTPCPPWPCRVCDQGYRDGDPRPQQKHFDRSKSCNENFKAYWQAFLAWQAAQTRVREEKTEAAATTTEPQKKKQKRREDVPPPTAPSSLTRGQDPQIAASVAALLSNTRPENAE